MLDLGCARYGLYGLNILACLVSPTPFSGTVWSMLDLGRARCGLYGVKYIDMVPLAPFQGGHAQLYLLRDQSEYKRSGAPYAQVWYTLLTRSPVFQVLKFHAIYMGTVALI